MTPAASMTWVDPTIGPKVSIKTHSLVPSPPGIILINPATVANATEAVTTAQSLKKPILAHRTSKSFIALNTKSRLKPQTTHVMNMIGKPFPNVCHLQLPPSLIAGMIPAMYFLTFEATGGTIRLPNPNERVKLKHKRIYR
jgi:hypothetical protein